MNYHCCYRLCLSSIYWDFVKWVKVFISLLVLYLVHLFKSSTCTLPGAISLMSREGIFIMPYLLGWGISSNMVSTEGLPQSSSLYDKQGVLRTCSYSDPNGKWIQNTYERKCKLLIYFVCLFVVLCPTQEFFTHMEMSPL